MNRRSRTLIVVGLAVALASVASYSVFRAIQTIPVREVTLVERRQVVGASRLEAGVALDAGQLRLVPWPASSPVPGGFTAIEEVVGRGLIAPLLPNEPVTESKLAPPGSGAGLPPMIVDGMRAMAVRVNDIVGVAGFVQPGTRVDVIATLRPASEPVSRIVLENVLVLAVGQSLVTAAAEGGQSQATVVTVLVSPVDTERLALASSLGQIVLALRNPLDGLPVETRGARMSALTSTSDPVTVRPAPSGRPRATLRPQPAAPPAPYSVEVIRGADRQTQVLDTKARGGGPGGGRGGGR